MVRALLAALMLAALSAGQLVAPPAAVADVTTLCRGYTDCAQQGMGDGGYGRASGSMYWRMYAGHNCTNYAAFRMVQSGLPNVRPWDGAGNATYWGTSMPSITDGVPAVGSVAWWRAGVYPAGSAGHVAYVEQVVSPDTIIVSQDSWGGDFSWARITRGSRGWPSGFIHFNDARLANTTGPTISGVAKVGSTLTADPGGWSPAATVGYQWRAGGVDVPGATGRTFSVGPAQEGLRIRLRVTATKPGYPATTALSPRTAQVLPGTLENLTAPSSAGDPVVDGTLTADPGSWHPAPDGVAVQWLADGAPVPGATGTSLVPDATLVGRALSVRVTAMRAGFSDVSLTTAATAPVRAADLVGTAQPVITDSPRLGETLQLATGSTAPAAEPTVQWFRDGRPVEGAGGTSYVLTADDLGARVSATVRWARPGYVPLEIRTGPTRPVKAVPTLAVQLRPAVGQLRVRADVVVPAGAVAREQVHVRTGRILQAVPLADGTAVTVLTGLRPATRTVRVVLPASSTVARAVWTGEVVIP